MACHQIMELARIIPCAHVNLMNMPCGFNHAIMISISFFLYDHMD